MEKRHNVSGFAGADYEGPLGMIHSESSEDLVIDSIFKSEFYIMSLKKLTLHICQLPNLLASIFITMRNLVSVVFPTTCSVFFQVDQGNVDPKKNCIYVGSLCSACLVWLAGWV